MTKISLVDYGVGNIFSVARAFEYIGAEVKIVADEKGISDADRLVLPGVGAFGDAMWKIRQKNLDDAIRHYSSKQRPLLGICLGMQLLLEHSTEFGQHTGLGIIAGKVEALPADTGERVPHIGWAPIYPNCLGSTIWARSVYDGVPVGCDVYFDHSYVAVPANKDAVLATTPLGTIRFCAALAVEQIVACQFHPEKSGEAGLVILKNFMRL